MKKWLGLIQIFGFFFLFNTAHAKVPVDGEAKFRAENPLAKLPLRFEKNEGQTSDEVKFLSRGRGYSMFFTPTEAVTVLNRVSNPPERFFDPTLSEKSLDIETSVIRMQVVGANKNSRITGQGKLPGTSNYFKGSDPSQWRQGVENFQKVHYEEVYPGIDLVYYGNQKKLEYDFVVKPGADPGNIELNFKGNDSLSIDAKGNLVLETGTRKMVQRAPVIYQTIDGQKESVEGRYEIKDNHNVAFKLAQYNPDHNLVIDPEVGFSTYFGGTSTDTVLDIVVDGQGDIYMTGWTVSPDFNVLNEIENATADVDVVVVKLEQTGDVPSLAWSTYLGGTGIDGGGGIALDGAGNVYVTGSTTSTDFDLLNEVEGDSGGVDVLVFKLEQSNNIPSLAYSTYLGGSGDDHGLGIAVDSAGNAYVTGVTGSTDFDTLNEIEGDKDSSDVFVFKLEQVNNVPSLAFSTYMGSSSAETPVGIGVDGSGNIYVAGESRSTDFLLKNPIPSPSGSGNLGGDFFVFKMEQTGNVPSIGFSARAGGFILNLPSPIGPGDSLEGMTVDSAGNIYLTGYIYHNGFPLKNNIGPTGNLSRFDSDIFVMKVEHQNNLPTIGYSTRLGGSFVQRGHDIAVDDAGTAYVFAHSVRGSIPIYNPLPNVTLGNNLLIKLEENNNVLNTVFFSYLGFDSIGSFVDIDDLGNAYIAGSSADPELALVNEIEGHNGDQDIYLMKVVFGNDPDNVPPEITLPAHVTAEATGFLSFPPIGMATATDDVSAPEDIIITNDAPSAGYLVGNTTVKWTAKDEAGNRAIGFQGVSITDTTAPLITLLGGNPINAEIGEPYIDPWGYAFDLVDGFVPFSVSSQVGATPGTFEVVFTATDSRGNTATATRVVNPVDTTAPVITILGDNPIDAQVGQPYNDPGATATDSNEGSIPVTLTTQIGAAPGTFEVVYSASDSSGNTATATRVVVVVP